MPFLIVRCFFMLCLLMTGASWAVADGLEFTVSRMGQGSPVVLVVGGIQGDEPGGFSAAALLTTHYTILDGTVIVVPNLNFPSIIKRSRGLHGDMNRKFADLSERDPEYETVRRIQAMMAAEDVDLILNLHDGSGFYRPTLEDAQHGPLRWGQSVIVDQSELSGTPFGQLENMAVAVAEKANARLLTAEHRFHVKNTHTGEGDEEMAKSLTWFGINQGKPSFGLEVSKNFGVGERAYYHLNMVESFFRLAGIDFQRNFPLSPSGVSQALGSNVWVALADNRIVLPMENARKQQAGTLPLPKGKISVVAPTPILAVVSEENKFTVHYGNNTLTSFKPQWLEADMNLDSVDIQVDGKSHSVPFGSIVPVETSFTVHTPDGYRVNAIGADLNKTDESNIALAQSDFLPHFSIDTLGTTFRVEVYRGQSFAGMFLVRFGTVVAKAESLSSPAIKGFESELGW